MRQGGASRAGAVADPIVVRVRVFGRTAGAVALEPGSRGPVAAFQYDDEFIDSGLRLSPFHVPLEPRRVFRFPDLNRDTFHGLPGFLADALPDAFGNRLIDAYMLRQGIAPGEISILQRLLYMGRRGMGALEFEPPLNIGDSREAALPLAMASLVESARQAIRGEIGSVAGDILRVGTSAGGARAKAVVGFQPESNELVSGQFDLPEGFQHWLLKFDGVDPDLELGRSHDYGRIEYAYSLMARSAGIEMSDCRLLEEGGRAHFMTRRFDREGNRKLHLQSLCGLQHADFNTPYVTDYELLLRTVQMLGLGKDDLGQAFRRMVFNVLSRNCDDHTKNFAFLMNGDGKWSLAPAYDLSFAHNPAPGKWTCMHQMLINGKTLEMTRDDLFEVGRKFNVRAARRILSEVQEAVRNWPAFAEQAGLPEERVARIADSLPDLGSA